MKMLFQLVMSVVVFCSLQPSLTAQTLVSAKPPIYPLAARAAGIDGPVTLKGVITREGKLEDIEVISGPAELQQAAIDAASTWVYKPYLKSGKPVEVDTKVTVNFNMGKGKDKAVVQAKAKEELARASQSTSPQASAPKQ